MLEKAKYDLILVVLDPGPTRPDVWAGLPFPQGIVTTVEQERLSQAQEMELVSVASFSFCKGWSKAFHEKCFLAMKGLKCLFLCQKYL